MTQIDFYSGASDKLQIACRLCLKVIRQALKIVVYIPDSSLSGRFDKLLWTFSPISFVPHCHAGEKMADVTPVILSSSREETQRIAHHDVLLNLHNEVPPDFDQFQRIIEIVVDEPDDKAAARKRYRFYQEQGLNIRHHKLD